MTEFLYDGVNPVQETSGATVLANILTGLGIDEFLTRTDVPAGITSHLLTDALGSTVALADSAGIIQTENAYEPFGKTTTTGVSNANPFQYTGRENDGTGLYYYRARYYHPALQRFISEDPILSPGKPDVPYLLPYLLSVPSALHSYAYVENNAINLVDPSGQLGLRDLLHHPAFKAIIEDMLSRLFEEMGKSRCPGNLKGLANILAGMLAASEAAHAGIWTYGIAASAAVGIVNPVAGLIATGLGSYWAMSELLRSYDLLNQGYQQFD